MTKDDFWKIIDESHRLTSDGDELTEVIGNNLRSLPPEEILSFHEHFEDCYNEAFRWDLWAVAYIINGGCSDDGFDYFRGWLIGKGRAYFEAALVNPERAADQAVTDECECEDLLYVSSNAYQSVIGRELPPTKYHRQNTPKGEPWDEDELESLYPKLWQRFSGYS